MDYRLRVALFTWGPRNGCCPLATITSYPHAQVQANFASRSSPACLPMLQAPVRLVPFAAVWFHHSVKPAPLEPLGRMMESVSSLELLSTVSRNLDMASNPGFSLIRLEPIMNTSSPPSKSESAKSTTTGAHGVIPDSCTPPIGRASGSSCQSSTNTLPPLQRENKVHFLKMSTRPGSSTHPPIRCLGMLIPPWSSGGLSCWELRSWHHSDILLAPNQQAYPSPRALYPALPTLPMIPQKVLGYILGDTSSPFLQHASHPHPPPPYYLVYPVPPLQIEKLIGATSGDT